jgi:formyl-CoA transferase
VTEPLSGIVVVEMTLAVQGPAAGLFLRDMGADVIKVEPPIGDPSRYGRGIDNSTPAETLGPQFVAVNRGKRSVCVDLSTDLGHKAVHALLARADVFLTNYREPALEKLGLGYADLRQRYPNLIYASVNGFGPRGPDAHKAMLDGAAVARGGLASMTGLADGPPHLPGAIIGDTSGAMHLALAVVTALLARERHGVAQRAQTSALGTQLWLQQWELTHVSMTGARLQPTGAHHPNIRGPYGIYRTRDGGAIMLAQTMAQDAWDAFCIFADLPELAFDPRWQTPAQRLGEGITDDDSAEIRSLLSAAFAGRTADEWEQFLRSQPEIIFERVRDWHEVLEDEQNQINGYVTSIEVPAFGEVRTVGNLITLSETPGSVKGGPPSLGEGNAEVLGRAGLTPQEIREITAAATSAREAAFAALQAAGDASPE